MRGRDITIEEAVERVRNMGMVISRGKKAIIRPPIFPSGRKDIALILYEFSVGYEFSDTVFVLFKCFRSSIMSLESAVLINVGSIVPPILYGGEFFTIIDGARITGERLEVDLKIISKKDSTVVFFGRFFPLLKDIISG